MRSKSLAAAIAAFSTLSIASASGGGEDIRLRLRPPCTPQAQRCIEKLSALIDGQRGASDLPSVGRGWRELIETDPECVIELGATGF